VYNDSQNVVTMDPPTTHIIYRGSFHKPSSGGPYEAATAAAEVLSRFFHGRASASGGSVFKVGPRHTLVIQARDDGTSKAAAARVRRG